MLYKLVKLWPLIVACVTGVTSVAIIKNTVDWHSKRLRNHERRITSVELNVAVAKANTDALVENLLDERQKRNLKREIDGLSAYVLKTAENKGEDE